MDFSELDFPKIRDVPYLNLGTLLYYNKRPINYNLAFSIPDGTEKVKLGKEKVKLGMEKVKLGMEKAKF